ncbi:hypothetical protein SAMN02949497_3399 [Methylomagnum ishizawai]|uniref:Uncharacterized protein n=1 Tax=Methylomagnum ishizawai TaxID=1760988 RepID=A0A1Y6D0R2_9GAMM|nr:hypothetical protein [Methylomagnum ishizawai]SMF96020.1 hypothetical protein SAMN02949497_3399 [Methylomagnum ishizawai]
MKHKTKFILLVCTGLGFWLWRGMQEGQVKSREAHWQYCQDHFCEGDILPKYNPIKQVALKLNGRWLIGPKEYFSGSSNGASFEWWEHKPLISNARRPDEMQALVKAGKGYDFSIEIFFRSSNIPPEPRGYKLVELAQANDWIASRTQVRPGLEAIQMKHVIGPHGYSIDHVTYYVATYLNGIDGLPPVATCDNSRAEGTGGTGFMWQLGIWVGVRMNQKHCADWPEIYLEIIRVLQLLKKA